ncbi:MAG TPA: hypothetical protein VHW74_02890 [Mycobacteriales bacterium]|jgi:hypothetical protein|nr:hypothetical protein [Mycobacteriales bacterium]
MVEVAALSVAAATAELDRIVASAGTAPTKDDVERAYEVLLGATADSELAPFPFLATAIGLVGAAEVSVVESLPPRAMVALRLLRAGAAEAAWAVLLDNATGVVKRPFRASTSSGAERTEWVLPLLTAIESPHVYADLPGFRDPRYSAPDAAYEIGDAIKLRCQIDEVIPGTAPKLSGWAALDLLQTEPDESVAVVARSEDREIRWAGMRHRRADLVGGTRDTLRRRAWAGWSAELDPAKLATDGGQWMLWLEVGHRGVARRVRLGRSVTPLGARAVGKDICDRPRTHLVEAAGGWSLQLRK